LEDELYSIQYILLQLKTQMIVTCVH